MVKKEFAESYLNKIQGIIYKYIYNIYILYKDPYYLAYLK